jgi:hypothetical protein
VSVKQLFDHRRNYRFFALWYFTIALGFVLLGIHKLLTGEKPWLIIIRFVIAAGFAALGYLELYAFRRK